MKEKLFENVSGNQFKLRSEGAWDTVKGVFKKKEAPPAEDGYSPQEREILDKVPSDTWVKCPACFGKQNNCPICKPWSWILKNMPPESISRWKGFIPPSVAVKWKKDHPSEKKEKCPYCKGKGSIDKNWSNDRPGDNTSGTEREQCPKCFGSGIFNPKANF